ncbi:MAG: class IV adenylate cyclase [Candidatus Thorarchaeota archaeon]|nr:MAG: class IV adenylate cyclase [Candidatus Thorarchaeota archaeon]
MVRILFEVEVKIPIDAGEPLAEKLLSAHAEFRRIEVHVDSYYNHPCRDFSSTDEALRVRHKIVEESATALAREVFELTYKGPKIDPVSKTRVEVSTRLTSFTAVCSILSHLGFELVREVRKRRSIFQLGNMEICIDRVEDLGVFVEFEVDVGSNEQVTPARERIFKVAQELGLNPEDSIRESYLELLLAADNN